MSDIFIKASSGTAASAWKKALGIFIKASSGTAAAAWKTATNVYINISGGTNGWTRVWPLSGVFSTSDPYIKNSAGTHLTSSNKLRMGDQYYGVNGTWNPNGWSITSYTYNTYSYDGPDLILDTARSTFNTGTYTGQVSIVPTDSYDRKYFTFAVTANASNSAYSGTAESANSDGRIQVIRYTPRIATGGTPTLSAGPYYEGNTISYGASWDTSVAYKPDSASTRTSLGLLPGTIKWYSVNSLSNIYSTGTRTEITRVSGLYSWTIQQSDNLVGQYIIAEETVFNSGSDFAYGNNGFANGVNQQTIATSTAVQASQAPGAFSIISATKGYPVVGSQGALRPITVSWGASTNATSYSYFIEQSSDGTTWTTSTTPNTPYTPFTYANTSTTSTSLSGIQVSYGTYYRISVRAKSASGLTTDASNIPFTVDPIAPGDPTSLSISSGTLTQNSVSIAYTNGSAGSNTYNGVQYSIDNKVTWSATNATSPIPISGLSASTTYTVYLRSVNADGAYSAGNASISVTTLANPQSTGQMRRLTMPVAFTNTSQNIWIGTNGYVSTTVDPTTTPGTSWPSAGGVVIGPFVADDYYISASTYADASNFYVRYQGRGLSESSQTLDYLMKFYWANTTVDVYFIQNTSAYAFSTDAIRYGGTMYQTWASSTSITGMTIPAGLTTVSTSPTSNNDDGRVQVTATKPLLNLTTNPAYGASTSTATGWTASISTAAVPSGGTYSVVSQTAGSASVNATTGALTASGLSSGGSSTVTVRYSLSGYNSVDITASGTATVATPTVASISYIPLGNTGTQYTTASANFTGSQDDGYWTFTTPYTFIYNGTSYNTIYVGTNSYITFGGGSTAFSSLSASNPPYDKVMVYAGDRSSNSVYWYTSGTTIFNLKLNCGLTSGTPGSDIQWELYGNSGNGTKRLDVTIVSGSGGTTLAATSTTSFSSLGASGTAWKITSQ